MKLLMAMGEPKKEAAIIVQWARENGFSYKYALYAAKEILRSYRLGGMALADRTKKAAEDDWRKHNRRKSNPRITLSREDILHRMQEDIERAYEQSRSNVQVYTQKFEVTEIYLEIEIKETHQETYR